MKNLLTLLICLLTLHLFAQAPCEFDSVYWYKSEYSTGSKIIELKNAGGYLILGQTNLGGGINNPGYPQPLLLKTDACGYTNFIKSFVNLQGSNSVTGIDLLELDNGRIVFASNYNKGTDVSKGMTMLYLNPDGSIIWGHTFGDKSKKYYPEKLTQITANKFLLTGSVLTNKKRASVIVVDIDGNVLFDSSFSADTSSVSYFTSTYVNKLNEIELFGVEDSSVLYVRIDTLGNLLYKQKTTKVQAGFKSIDRVTVNETGNNLVISGNYNQFLYLARLSKDMQKLNDVTTEYEFYYSSNLKKLPNNQYAYSAKKYSYTHVLIIDSLLYPIWLDTVKTEPHFYDFIKSNNHSLLCLGVKYYGFGSGAAVLTLKKKNTITFVNYLQIKGPNYIDVKNCTVQLEALISPTNATNKQLAWSLSDTNIASITQTGFLTPKNNGVVTVTATATDGSLIKSTTSISINNQKVGINELVVDENHVTLYPNPAKNQLTVICNVTKVQAIQILDMSGKLLNTYTNTSIDLSTSAAGLYLVKVETDKGVVFKKLVIASEN